MDFSRTASPSAQAVSSNVALTPADQTITSLQDGDGYYPAETVVFSGLPTHWKVTATAPFSCASSLSSQDLGFQDLGFQDLGFQGVLKQGQNIIELPALKAGTYKYSCTMGM